MLHDVEQALRSVTPGSGACTFRAECCFDPALPLFQGHFPGNPVVPGVLQLETVRQAMEQRTGKSLAIARVIKAKFSNRILPGERIDIEGQWKALGEGLEIRAQWKAGPQKKALIILELKER